MGLPLVLVMAAAFAFRLWLAGPVIGPSVFHDELGYTGVARWVAGQQDVALHGPFYHPLYGLLLTPLAWAFPDPGTYHRAGQVLNAILLAGSVPLLYQLGRQVLALDRRASVLAAAVGSTTAGALVHATLLLSEALLVPLAVLLVLLAHRYLRSGTVSSAAALAAGATMGYLAHPRALGWIGAVSVLAVASGAGRLVPWRSALVVITGSVGGVLATDAINGRVREALYPMGSTADIDPFALLSELGREPQAALAVVVGASWYLAASTVGIGVIGVAAMATGAADRSAEPARRSIEVFLLLNVVLALALSAVQLAPRFVGGSPDRSDLPAYGRYVEHWLPAVVVWATAALRTGRVRVRWVVAAAAGVSAALAVVAMTLDEAVWDRPLAATNVSGLYLVRAVWGSFDLPDAAPWVGALAVTGVLVSCRSRWWVGPVVAGAVAVASATTMVDQWLSLASWNSTTRSRLADRVDVDLGPVVLFDVSRGDWNAGLYRTQFWQPDLDVRLATDDGGYAEHQDAIWVLAALHDPPPAELGPRLVGTEYLSAGSALWVVEGPTGAGRLVVRELQRRGGLFPPGFEHDPRTSDRAAVAEVEVVGHDGAPVEPGAVLAVQITHAGEGSPWPTAWPTTPVRVGGRLIEADTGRVLVETRHEIRPLLRPGESTTVEVRVPGPDGLAPGRSYHFLLGVVQDEMRWFEAGSRPHPVLVMDSPPAAGRS